MSDNGNGLAGVARDFRERLGNLTHVIAVDFMRVPAERPPFVRKRTGAKDVFTPSSGLPLVEVDKNEKPVDTLSLRMPAAKRLYGTTSSGAPGSQMVCPRYTNEYGESDHHTALVSARRASMIFW